MRAAVLIACLALPLASAPSWGQEDSLLGRLVPPEHGRSLCYSRTYDAEHLRRHPEQRVTAMTLAIRYHRHEPDRWNPKGQRNYYFAVVARVRGERSRLIGTGECFGNGESISCSQECDGGAFTATRHASGDLLLDLTTRGRLRMTRGCGGGDDEEDTVDLTPGTDDRVFRLSPAPARVCSGLMQED